ncbi:MAG: flagellar biosynthesis anti-sigma factor FlgM [Candidatus Adiutrix sp.]|jgi:negative regulator of flagellin synthesis FlgM|nr:flagellar biosynthesis anti-sigma factor FlgM [Candidatus Adiutrix sp.]
MKIDTLNPFINKDAQAAGGREKPAVAPNAAPVAEEPGRPADVVQLSSRSKMIARSQELAAQAPEIREGRVNELRERIQAGTYNVSGRVVAESMLKKSITEV